MSRRCKRYRQVRLSLQIDKSDPVLNCSLPYRCVGSCRTLERLNVTLLSRTMLPTCTREMSKSRKRSNTSTCRSFMVMAGRCLTRLRMKFTCRCSTLLAMLGRGRRSIVPSSSNRSTHRINDRSEHSKMRHVSTWFWHFM